MKVKIKNLGILKQAELSLGNLTIICGGNNTGKTYATYSLFGFLDTWRQLLKGPTFSLKEKVDQLLSDGVISLDLQEYVQQCEISMKRKLVQQHGKLSRLANLKMSLIYPSHY